MTMLITPSPTSPPSPSPRVNAVRVWDLPTRVFHWSLMACVVGAIVTVNIGGLWMDWHVRFGIAALCLILFRIIWGILGPRYARFSQFVKGPKAVWAYIKQPSPAASVPHPAGHNPIGGWSVMMMLLVVLAQATTGLFASDDIMTQGPLYAYVSNASAETITNIHHLISKLLIALIIVHTLAIGVYALRGRRLVPPMVTGDVAAAELTPNTPSSRDDILLRLWALWWILLCGGLGYWLLYLGSSNTTGF